MSKAGEARKTEEQKIEEALERAKTQAEYERSSKIIGECFSTGAGRRTLRMIMERCKYQSPITSVDNEHRISTENMIHNGALQGFYLWLRKQVNIETLIAVENRGLEEDEKN